jgi:hypothetical protein
MAGGGADCYDEKCLMIDVMTPEAFRRIPKG